MKKILSIIALTFLFLLISINLSSASLCKGSSGYYYDCESIKPFDHRYQGDPNKPSANNYNSNSYSYSSPTSSDSNLNYNSYDGPSKLIFKGSYGNYRYEKYVSGDYNPLQYFISYGAYGYPSFFSGYSYYPYFGGGYSYYPFYGGYGFGYYDYSPFVFWF